MAINVLTPLPFPARPGEPARLPGLACTPECAAPRGRARRPTPLGKGHVPVSGIEAAREDELPPRWNVRGDVVWLPDERGVRVPLALRPREASILAELQSGRSNASDLEPELRLLFSEAGLLATPARFERGRAAWQGRLEQARANMCARGFAVLRDLLPATLRGALRAYARELAARELGEGGRRTSACVGDDPVAAWLCSWLQPLTAPALPEPAPACAAAFECFRAGAQVERHLDAAPADYTLTIAVDASPTERAGSAWPLYLESPGGVVEVRLATGDALLFKGRALPHFRSRLARGRTAGTIEIAYTCW